MKQKSPVVGVLVALSAVLASGPAVAQSQIQPILVRPAKEFPNCQIYLKADGSRLLFKGKPIAAGGRCPSEFLPGTVTRFGPETYRLKVSGEDCIITPTGMGRCQ